MKPIPYQSDCVHGTILEGKTKIGKCDNCGKEVTYLYECTYPGAEFWFAECKCYDHIVRPYLSLEWPEES